MSVLLSLRFLARELVVCNENLLVYPWRTPSGGRARMGDFRAITAATVCLLVAVPRVRRYKIRYRAENNKNQEEPTTTTTNTQGHAAHVLGAVLRDREAPQEGALG